MKTRNPPYSGGPTTSLQRTPKSMVHRGKSSMWNFYIRKSRKNLHAIGGRHYFSKPPCTYTSKPKFPACATLKYGNVRVGQPPTWSAKFKTPLIQQEQPNTRLTHSTWVHRWGQATQLTLRNLDAATLYLYPSHSLRVPSLFYPERRQARSTCCVRAPVLDQRRKHKLM